MVSGMCSLTSSWVRKPLALPIAMSSRMLRSLSFWDVVLFLLLFVVLFLVGAPVASCPAARFLVATLTLRGAPGTSSPSSSAESSSKSSFIADIVVRLPGNWGREPTPRHREPRF